jgi:hypothetical protein
VRSVTSAAAPGVVGRQRAVDEEVLIAGIDEELGPVGPNGGDQLAGSVDVALVCEELIVRLAVDPNRHTVQTCLPGPEGSRVWVPRPRDRGSP